MTKESFYNEFYQVLKSYILTLNIEKEEKVQSCSENRVLEIEQKLGHNLPLSYREFLKTIGKEWMFHFTDGALVLEDDFEEIWEDSLLAIEEANYNFETPYIPIGYDRYGTAEYGFHFLYIDQSDDPEVLWFYPYGDLENRIESVSLRFTEMIISFFKESLGLKSWGFHFVDENEKNENIVKERYLKWFEDLYKQYNQVKSLNNSNSLVRRLHIIFKDFYEKQAETIEQTLYEENILKEDDLNFYRIKKEKRGFFKRFSSKN